VGGLLKKVVKGQVDGRGGGWERGRGLGSTHDAYAKIGYPKIPVLHD